MADLQWLKLSTNFFDNNKIKLLESERDGDTLIRVWIQLLTIAMKCNYQGRLSVTEDKPMTVDEFSKIMGKSKKKITKCLEKFEELKMIIKVKSKTGLSTKVLINLKKLDYKIV